MWCVKMFCIILTLSFTSFVNTMPASTFVVPSYPPQLALFTRFDKPRVVRDEVPRKFSSKDEITNWASYAMRVMAAKLNGTFFSIKEKMKKSVSDDDVKREPFQRASNFTGSDNSEKNVDRSKKSNNTESITKMHLVSSTIVTKNVVPDMVPTITVQNNVVPNSTESNNMVSDTIPTMVSTTSTELTTPTPADKEIRNTKPVDMSQKQVEDLDAGMNDDPKRMIHAERRQFNLPIKTFGDPTLFNPQFSLADDPRDYQHFSNYLSQLFSNHYDLGENKIIIRAPDFVSPVSNPAAYIPLFVQHPDFSGYKGGQVIKNQFGGGDEGTNSKNNLAALRAFAPSMPSISSIPATSSTTSTTTTTTTTTTSEKPPPKTEVEDFSKPIKLLDASRESIRPSTEIRPIISVPFEAIITITRESHSSLSTPSPLITPTSAMPSVSAEKPTSSLPINFNQDSRNYYEIVTRDPPDDFPPFFKENNSFNNEFGKVDVVFEDEIAKNKDKNYNKKVYKNMIKSKDMKDKKNDCDHNSATDESSSVNVIVENEITKNEDKDNDNYNQNRFLDDDTTIEDEDSAKKTNKNKKDRARKRQTSTFKQLLQILGLTKKKVPKSNSTDIQLSTSPVIKVFTAKRVAGAKFEQTPPLRGRRNQTFESQESPENPDTPKNEVIPINEKPPKSDDSSQNQEFDDDDDEGEGSLGSITDLLPLVIPVLEDLSDPDSDTDLAELLDAGIPLLQGLSEGENEDGTPINIGATISPIIQAISAGKDGQDSNSGAIITPIISLAAPLIGPILGPVIGPLLRSSSNPTGEGSSLPALINSITGPLLKPTEEGGTSPLSNLIAEIIFELSKDLSAAGKEGFDLGGLISSVISGVLAGTSAGLSGGKDKHKPDSYGAFTNNGQYGSYGQSPVPANSVNPISLIFTTVKDILNSSINAVSGLLGASSASSSSSSDNSPAPPPAYGPPNYKPPSPNSSYNNKFSSQNKSQKNSFSRI